MVQNSKVERSLLPELIVAAKITILVSALIQSIWIAYQIEDPEVSWWIALLPTWIGAPIAIALLVYGFCAPGPYLRQLRNRRVLQVGTNPSAIELIPLMISSFSGIGVILLFLAFAISICAYISSGYSFDIVYTMIPLYAIHILGIARTILIVGDTLKQLLIHLSLLVSEVILVIRIDASTDLSFVWILLPIYFLMAGLFGMLVLEAYRNSKEWDLVSLWKWILSSFQLFWTVVFFGILAYKLENAPSSGIWLSYITIFVPLEIAISCHILRDSISFYKLVEPSKLNPTSLDIPMTPLLNP